MVDKSSDADIRGTLGTVRNAMLLLDLMSEGPAYRQLSELAELSGLSLPTVHRLLRSLVLAQLIEQQERTSRYGLGPELARLSQRYLARLPIIGALSPYLVPLRNEINATIHVGILVRGSVVYVDRVDSTTTGVFRGSHRTEPALATAAGRVLASRSSDEDWARAVSRSDSPTRPLPPEARKEWSESPFLVVDGTVSANPEIAVPVFDGSGTVCAALAASLTAPADQATITLFSKHLTETASAAGRTLGHG